jgi:hypothetical protein
MSENKVCPKCGKAMHAVPTAEGAPSQVLWCKPCLYFDENIVEITIHDPCALPAPADDMIEFSLDWDHDKPHRPPKS